TRGRTYGNEKTDLAVAIHEFAWLCYHCLWTNSISHSRPRSAHTDNCTAHTDTRTGYSDARTTHPHVRAAYAYAGANADCLTGGRR
ncbi:MAG: hypothetical protein WBH57_08280, partial [Anaerolineae bacterium]